MKFLSNRHRWVFIKEAQERGNTDRGYVAVLFLLTADGVFWNRIKSHVQNEIIHFEDFPMVGCTKEEYTLFQCAKDIYYDLGNVSVSELSDASLISPAIFALIIDAMRIARRGVNLAKLKKGEEET